jgi:phosphatidate cytidylyltransferase
MRSRLIIAAIFIPILLILFIFVPILGLAILFSAVSMIAVYEVLCATGLMKHRRIQLYSLIYSGCVPFWVYYGADGSVGATGLCIYTILLFIETIVDRKRITFEKIGTTAFVAFIIPYFFSSFVRLGRMELGRFFALLPLLIAFISDAGGLFFGLMFGRHKLAPELSPKKSVEGAVGSVIVSLLASILYGVIVRFGFKIAVSFPLMCVYAVLGSVVSQFGDLCFSFIKRQYGIKDFGRMLAGHGGIMDRFDSVFFCAPFIEMLVMLIPVFSKAVI